MIGDLRLEFLRRIMTALIKISKGNTYLERLESSYKTNMIVFLFVLISLDGIFVKYIELNHYAKDAEIAYLRLVEGMNEYNSLLKSLRIANDDKTETIKQLKEDKANLTKRADDLSNELELLKTTKGGTCKK